MLKMTLCRKFSNHIKEGIALMADNMKMLLYDEVSDIFEQIDFENDRAFLEPLLFAYFNRGNREYPISHILYGYFQERTQKELVVFTNKEGIAFVPQIGYFSVLKGNSISLNVIDISPMLLENGIELLSYQHPLLENRFRLNRLNQFDLADRNDENYHKILEVEITETTKYHHKNIQKAFNIIAEYMPELNQEILLSNRRIVLFHNPRVLCFVTIETHGTSYLSTIPANDEVFFVEEIIHQCSHNTFNTLLFNKEVYFKIDVENITLGGLIGRENEDRSVFSVFHGLYTVAKRFEAFYILYQNNVFQDKQKHEFLGRFSDLKKRFRLGLELLDLPSVFTEKGLDIYYSLEQVCIETINKTVELDGIFDLSNQPSEFSYERFCELNPLVK